MLVGIREGDQRPPHASIYQSEIDLASELDFIIIDISRRDTRQLEPAIKNLLSAPSKYITLVKNERNWVVCAIVIAQPQCIKQNQKRFLLPVF